MPIEHTRTKNHIHVSYIKPTPEQPDEIEYDLAAWFGIGRSQHAIEASIVLARVGLKSGHEFSADYKIDKGGRAQAMHVSGFTYAVHAVVGVLVSGENDTVLYKSINYYDDEKSDNLYGDEFAKPKFHQKNGDGFINPPGAQFVFGNENIIKCIRSGLKSATSRQSLADELYEDIYKTLQVGSVDITQTNQFGSSKAKLNPHRQYLVDPSMPLFIPLSA